MTAFFIIVLLVANLSVGATALYYAVAVLHAIQEQNGALLALDTRVDFLVHRLPEDERP